MSEVLSDQTLTLNTQVAFSPNAYSFDLVEWVVFQNYSPFALRATVGSNVIIIPAWEYYPYQVGAGHLKTSILVTPYLQTIPGAGFTNTLSVTLFNQYETPDSTIAHPLGGAPTDLTIASEVISNNQPSGNTIVFGAPNGDSSASGATNIKNNGVETLGDTSNSGSLTINHETAGTIDKVLIANGSSISFTDNTFQLADLSLGASDPNLTMENSAGNSSLIISTSSPNIDLSSSAAAVNLLTAGSIKSKSGTNVTLDTNSASDSVFLKNNGASILTIAQSLITATTAIKTTLPAVSASGSTSGSANLYEFIQGNVRCIYISVLNYNSTQKDLALPDAFTNGAFFWVGGIGPSGSGGINLMLSGAAVTVNIITALAAAGGSIAAQTGIFSASFGYFLNAGFDTVRMLTTGGATRNAPIIIIGN